MKDYSNIINSFSTDRPLNKPATSPSQEMLHDLLNSLKPMPPVVTEQYLMRVKRVASFFGLDKDDDAEEICLPEPAVPVTPARISPKINRKVFDYVYKLRKNIQLTPKIKHTVLTTPVALLPTNQQAIVAAVTQQKPITTLVAQIKLAMPNLSVSVANQIGLSLRDSQIAQSYAAPTTTNEEAEATLATLKAGSQLVSNFIVKSLTGVVPSDSITANLITSDMAFDVNSRSSSPADLLAFTANQEYIRRKKLQEARAVSDFKERQPNVMFIVDYVYGKKYRGQIVGWKKVADASGYILKRYNIFTNEESSYTIFNEELNERFKHIDVYVKNSILPFYDVDENNVIAFLDEEAKEHNFFIYKLSAFQTFTESKTSAFITPVVPSINISDAQKQEIINKISLEDESPYPHLAKRLLGDASYDWILAGINIRNSISRRDDRSITRKYSYLDANPQFLFQEMENKRLVVPNSVGVVVENITRGISKFGIVSMLKELFRETGILYSFEGIDPAEDGEFTRPALNVNEGKFLGIIASAIDAETFSLDLRTLVTNLTKFIGGGIDLQQAVTGIAVNLHAGVQEISIDNAALTVARARLNSELGNLDDVVDLYTFEGINRLLRTIRIISDLGPSRD